MDGAPATGTTLRLALGMRGGVSLAVWIGGAAAELDDLRCAGDEDQYHRGLLTLGGYDTVEVDVMSGASAGGLNAVLAAAAMVGRRRVSEMRETWLQVGGLRELLESDVGGDRSRRSLLGGAYFRERLHDEVQRLLSPPDDPRVPPLDHRLEVFLSATVHHGLHVQIEDDDYSPDTARRSGALFHFRHLTANATTSDLCAPGVVDDLTRAARTTASFPTAFEPMPFQPGDMPGELILPALATEPVWLLDGGIVDNIPVARAIDGVPNVPASTATDRWLIYLQPSPDAMAAPTASRTGTPALLEVAAGLLSAFRSESILDDVEVLRRHNLDTIEAAQGWTAAVGDLSGDTDDDGDTDRRDFDGTRIVALLLDPIREVVWRPIGIAVDPSPLGDADSSQLAAFRAAVEAAVVASAVPVRPFAAIVRTAALLIDWARALERAPGAAAERLADVGRAKLGCYHAMQLAQVLTATIDFAGLQRASQPAPGPTPDAAAIVAAMATIAAALNAEPALITLIAQMPLPRRELAAATDSSPLLASLFRDVYRPGAPDPTADVGATLWAFLADRAAQLAGIGGAPGEQASTAAGARVDVGPLARAVASCAGDRDRICRLLRLVDRRTAGVHHGRATALPTHLQYVRIAGSNLSPLCLRPADLAYDGPRFATAALLSDAHGSVAPKMKLAGSDLANFSAFISQRWRANDWMWGRLDAAKSVVDVVTAHGRLPHRPDAQHRAIATIVTAPFVIAPDVPPGWADELRAAAADLWATHEGTVRRELDEQFDSVADDRLRVTKQVLVLRRHWEILAAELPSVLRANFRPVAADAEALPPTIAASVAAYEASPRSFGDVWGMRWSTALGIRAAYEIWAATRPSTLLKRTLRAPFKPLPMSTLGTALARNRGLLGLALLFNLVVLPRLHGGGAWVCWALGVAGGLGLAKVFGARTATLRPTPLEPHGRVYRALTALTFAASGAVLAVARLRHWLYDIDAGTPLTHFSRDLLVPFVALAVAAGFVSTVLLWCWARWLWRIVAGLAVGGLTGFWVVFSRMVHTADAGWLVRLGFGFGSLWWAVLLSVSITTTIAHLAFRRNVAIAEYAKD